LLPVESDKVDVKILWQLIDSRRLLVDCVSSEGWRILFNLAFEGDFKSFRKLIDWVAAIVDVTAQLEYLF